MRKERRRWQPKENVYLTKIEPEMAHEFQQVIAALGRQYVEQRRFPRYLPVIEFGLAVKKVLRGEEYHYYLDHKTVATALQLTHHTELQPRILGLLTEEAELAKATLKDLDETADGIPPLIYAFLEFLEHLKKEEVVEGVAFQVIAELFNSLDVHITPQMRMNTEPFTDSAS